jgi:hypothetical protein
MSRRRSSRTDPLICPETARPSDDTGDDELKVLLATYNIERSADDGTFTSYIGLMTVAIATVSLTGLVLLQDPKRFGWAFAALPILPLPVLALGATLLDVVELRSVYLRGIEQELSRRIPGVTIDAAPLPAFHRLSRRIWYGTRGVLGQLVLLVPFGALYVVDLLESYRRASKEHAHGPALASLISCSAAVIVLVGLYITKRVKPKRWRRYVTRLDVEDDSRTSRNEAARRRD